MGERHGTRRTRLLGGATVNWNHYRPHAGLGGKMVKPYPQDMNAPVREVSFLGGLLHGYRREPMAA